LDLSEDSIFNPSYEDISIASYFPSSGVDLEMQTEMNEQLQQVALLKQHFLHELSERQR
jgi:hypothetical protein